MAASEDRRILRTQKNLKDALLALLEDKALRELSITEVAKKAKCNRVTFYAHYKDLNELLAAIFDDYLHGLVEYFRKSFQHLGRFSSKDIQRHLPVFEYIYQNQPIFSLIIKGEVLPGSQNQFCESLVQVSTTELALEGEHKLEMEIPALNYYLVYGMLGFFIYWIKEDFKDSPETMAEKIADLHGKIYEGGIVIGE